MAKSALYTRTATLLNNDSLLHQRQELINYSKNVLGIEDYEIFEDAGCSGVNTDRPKYNEMMSRIRNKEFTHLLVWRIDRISRNTKDFIEIYNELKANDVTLISRNDQDFLNFMSNPLLQTVFLELAELEKKQLDNINNTLSDNLDE